MTSYVSSHFRDHSHSMFVVFLFLYISYIIQLLPQKLSAEPRHNASAEALAVARRPKEASREKTRPPPVSRGSFPFFFRRVSLRTLQLSTTPPAHFYTHRSPTPPFLLFLMFVSIHRRVVYTEHRRVVYTEHTSTHKKGTDQRGGLSE